MVSRPSSTVLTLSALVWCAATVAARQPVAVPDLAEVLQRVVVNGQTPKAAAAWGQDRIAEIMKS